MAAVWQQQQLRRRNKNSDSYSPGIITCGCSEQISISKPCKASTYITTKSAFVIKQHKYSCSFCNLTSIQAHKAQPRQDDAPLSPWLLAFGRFLFLLPLFAYLQLFSVHECVYTMLCTAVHE